MTEITAHTKSLEISVEDEYISGCINRAKSISLVSSVCYFLFGFSSFKTIQHFNESLTLLSNLWPRFILVSVPFLLVYFILTREKLKRYTRLIIWSISFGIINFISACIHVWPLAWNNPEVLLYFTSVNLLIFIASSLYVALPLTLFAAHLIIFSTTFFAPLLIIAHRNPLVFNSLLSDVINYTLGCIFLTAFFRRYLSRFLHEKIEKIHRSSFFLDSDIRDAIDDGVPISNLEMPRAAFIFAFDLRGYTDFLKDNEKKDPQRNILLTKTVNNIVRTSIRKYGGKTHKTAGDGFLCLAVEPVMANELDFIEEIKEGNHRKRQYQLANLIRAYLEIETHVRAFFTKELGMEMDFCGALHFGELQYAILGDEMEGEYDIVSVDIPRTNRLEEYTKFLRSTLNLESLVIISEAAFEYFDPQLFTTPVHSFEIPPNNPVRSFPEFRKIYYLTPLRYQDSILSKSSNLVPIESTILKVDSNEPINHVNHPIGSKRA